MATYVMLMKLTHEGAAQIDDLPAYLDRLQRIVGSNNGRNVLACATLGAYDAVLAADFGNEADAVNVAADIAKIGLTSVQTLKSFTSSELSTFWRGHQ